MRQFLETAAIAVRGFLAGEWLRRWRFQPAPALPAPQPVEAVAPIIDEAETEQAGQWYFRKHLLDNLDDYFSSLRLVRSAYPDLYDLQSRIGGVLVPAKNAALGSHVDLPQGDQRRPFFGCFFWPDEAKADDNMIVPKFCAIQRMDKCSAYIERVAPGEVTYALTLLHPLPLGQRTVVVPHQCHIGLSADGTARMLRERKIVRQQITGRGGRRFTVVKGGRALKVPDWVVDYGIEHKRDGVDACLFVFRWTFNTLLQAQAGLRVTVERGPMVAAFHIDMLRTPYFFADRDAGELGRRKKIFHIVRTHARSRRGKTTWVKSHFRGERQFKWNGYRVTISMPGLHHMDMTSANFGAYDGDQIDAGEAMGAREVGAIIRKAITK